MSRASDRRGSWR